MYAAFVTLIVATIINISLGLFVLLRNRNKRSNQLFFLMALSVVGWTISNYATNYSFENIIYNEITNRLAFIFGYLIAFFGLAFTYIYPVAYKNARTEKVVINLISAFIIGLSFTSLVSGHVVYEEIGLHFYAGTLTWLYAVCFLLLVALSCRNMITVIRSSADDQRKSQARYILVAFASTGVLGILLNLVIPIYYSDWTSTNFGPLVTVLLVGLIAYSMVKHGMFDIRSFFVRATVYTLTLVVLGALYIGPFLFLSMKILGINFEAIPFLITVLVGTLLANNYDNLKRWFNRITNKIFYRDSYNAQDFLNKINSKIVTNSDLHTLLNNVSDEIEATINVSKASFYIDSDALIDFHTAGGDSTLFAKPEWANFIDLFSKYDTKIIYASSNDLEDSISSEMRDLNIELVLKMTSKTDVVGYMILSERKSGVAFNSQDIQVLEIIADELAITVQNMVQLEQIAQFNITLQKKIDDATKELQQTNEKLRSLDEAKDEFISMASHQLRTPLTSVKGYISMLLEGDAGDLNDTQKKFLDQAFISSQRMVYLIADLLNVSRLKTGKFVIEKTPTYLPDVVESEISQLYETAKARELNLEFKKPSEFVTLDLDETKTRQVIMNFVDNAIYYTPRGGKITVALKQLKNSVEYTVTDTGIGVPKKEQHHLFTKFYRAGNAKKSRPDGTGLGLYMAKKVIIAQGGHIIFKTQEGKGSTFGFSFPITDKQQESNS